jgi:tetratricopeptide (TPR) repeat protein
MILPRFMRFQLSCLIFSILSGALSAQENYYDPVNILRFADNLYQEKDYIRAATEYERYLSDTYFEENSDSILFRLSLCYQKAGNFEKAVSRFKDIYYQNPPGGFKNEAEFQIAYCYFESGQYNKSLQFLNSLDTNFTEYRVQLDNLAVLNYLYQKKWNDAYLVSRKVDSNEKYQPALSRVALNRLSAQGKELPRKSQTMAGVLSSIIPGSGKIYGHRYSDGIYSFVLVGISGWQAFKGFHKDGTKSTRGWIYGTLGTIFYAGNIYGSAVAVNIYNEKLEDDFIKGINVSVYLK